MVLLWEITGQYIQLSKQFMQNQQGCPGTNFWVFLLLHINNHNQISSNQPDHDHLNKIRWPISQCALKFKMYTHQKIIWQLMTLYAPSKVAYSSKCMWKESRLNMKSVSWSTLCRHVINNTSFNMINKLCQPIKKYKLYSICGQMIFKYQPFWLFVRVKYKAVSTVVPNRKTEPKQYF
jgi:hypothetical protein